MQYTAKTPEEYLHSLDDDWRKPSLLSIRDMILSHQDIIEKIEYKMLAFGSEKETLFHLNAQKNYVSLYVGDIAKVDPDRTLLADLNYGKGCIRFSKSTIPENTQIQAFIKKAYEYWKEGRDLDC